MFSLGTTHGPQTANITSRHVGDLGNLTTDSDGNVVIDMEDYIIQLYNATQSIVNRSVVVHLLRDDGGQGGFDDSNTTGYDFVTLEMILSIVQIEMLDSE
jgi:Cu-Zn family superoxide dismutase